MEIRNLRYEVRQAVSDADAGRIRQMLVSAGNGWTAHPAVNIHSLRFERTGNPGPSRKKDTNRESFSFYYTDDEADYISLLKKSRRKDCFLERVSTVSKDECERIIAGDFEFLNGAADPLLFEFYSRLKTGDMRPRMLVDHKRETFTCRGDDALAALKSDFYTGLNTSDFLNDRHPTVKRTGPVILEVKYGKVLPEILSSLARGERKARAFALAWANTGI